MAPMQLWCHVGCVRFWYMIEWQLLHRMIPAIEICQVSKGGVNAAANLHVHFKVYKQIREFKYSVFKVNGLVLTRGVGARF